MPMMVSTFVPCKGEIMKRAMINGVTKIAARDASERNGGFKAAVKACPCTVLVIDVSEGPLGHGGLQYPDVVIVSVPTHTAFDLGHGGWIAEETRFPVLIHLEAYDEVAEALALRLGAQDVVYSEQPARAITERIAAVHRRWAMTMCHAAPELKSAPRAETATGGVSVVQVDA